MMTEKGIRPQLIRPRVFISYNHSDQDIADSIVNELLKAGHEIWIDRFDMKPGDSLIERISSGIKDASYLLILLSKSSVASQWVNRELEIALTTQLQSRHIKVIPCLVEDCEIPIFLRPILYADFRKNFARGIVDLLPAIELIDAVAAGRLTDDKEAWIHDWTIEWGLPENNKYYMNFIMLSWYGTENYSCYCFVDVEAQDALVERLDSYPSTFYWAKCFFMGDLIIDALQEQARNKGIRDFGIYLEEATESSAHIGLMDKSTNRLMLDIKIRARRLGEIGSKSLIYYIGNLLKDFISSYFDRIMPYVTDKESEEFQAWKRSHPWPPA